MLLISILMAAGTVLNCAGGIDDPGAFTLPDGQANEPPDNEPPDMEPMDRSGEGDDMDPADDPNDMDPPDDPPDDPAEIMDIAAPEFFVTACGGCHVETAPLLWQGLDLVEDGVGPRIAMQDGACPEGPIIDPADPEASTLIVWMRGTDECNSPVMPPQGGLDEEQIAEAIEWIDSLDGSMDLGSASDSP